MATTTPSSNRYHNVYPATPSSEKRRLKGLWQNREWWCNCDPRAKAVPRSVTSDTPNLGRGFWACPLRRDGCGFFLWFDEAKLREISLFGEDRSAATPSGRPSFTQTRLTDIGFEILGERRQSDPGTLRAEEMDGREDDVKPPQRVSSSQPEAERSSSKEDKGKGKAVGTGSASYEPLTPGPSAGVKRKYDAFADDDFDELGSDEERQLADMTDKSVEKFIRQHAYGDLNAADGQDDDAVASSSRPVARTLFPQAQSAKRSKTVSFEEPEPFPPTPTKNKGPRSSPTSTQQTTPPSSMDAPPPSVPSSTMTATQLNDDEDRENDHDITEQVMGLLSKQSVEPSVLQSVRNVLAMSARRTKGIAMGRDSARAALDEKKIKIARLQERIAMLESREQSLNGQITNIKANLMRMYEDN